MLPVRDPDNTMPISTQNHWEQKLSEYLISTIALSFMTGFLPFFSPLTFSLGVLWKIIFYLFVVLCLITCASIFLKNDRQKKLKLIKFYLGCVIFSSILLVHEIDDVEKSFVAATLIVCICATLGSCCSRLFISRLGAWIVVLNVSICAIDSLATVGLSNTLGRAAGFFSNPNIAGLAILLGASCMIQGVAPRWRYRFGMAVCTAVILTLSRSTAVVMLATVTVSLTFWIISVRHRRGVQVACAPNWLDALVGLGCVAWICLTIFLNSRFAVAFSQSYSTLGSAVHFFSSLSQALMGDSLSRVDLGGSGMENSVVARQELMLAALRAFLSGPFLGIGLTASHELAPHNMFLLLAVAFGYPGAVAGILVPVFLLAISGSRRLAFPVSVAGAMMISHDLLMPALVTPVALGCAYCFAKNEKLNAFYPNLRPRYAVSASIAIGLFFVASCAVIYGTARFSYIFPADVVHKTGLRQYTILMPRPPYSGVLKLDLAKYSDLGFFQRGVPLIFTTEPNVADFGEGHYTITDGYAIRFIPFTEVDERPTTYSLNSLPKMHPLFYVISFVLVIWSFAVNRDDIAGAREPCNRKSS